MAITDALGQYGNRGLLDGSYGLSIRVPPTLNYRSGSVVDGGVIQENSATLARSIWAEREDVTGADVLAPVGLRISGTLSGAEAAGASVSAYGISNSDAVTVAGNGQWSIRGLWPGEYGLVFSPPASGDDSLFPLGYWNGGPTLTADPNDERSTSP